MDAETPDLAALLERYRRFLEEHVLPLEPGFLVSGFAAVEQRLEAVRAVARSEGLWAPQLPADLYGLGLSLTRFAEVARVLGRSPLGHYAVNCQAPDAGNLELLSEHATDEQRRRWLEPLARGLIRSCFAMTEPGRAGSNPVWMDTRAVRDGGGWRLDGRKWFASSAEGAAFAVVVAVTDPEADRHRRASLFIVPTDTPGYRLVRNLPVMGEAGSGWASHGEVVLEGCRVPADALLGEEGAGFRMAQERLGPGRIHHCMRWVGIAERALEALCRRAAERELAPGRPLAEKGVVRAWIADTAIELEAARGMVRRAADAVDRLGSRGARVEISMIKVATARMMLDALDRAIQAHGGLGVTDLAPDPLAWLWRHERAARIYDGPDEVHREVVARAMLRRFGGEGDGGREGS